MAELHLQAGQADQDQGNVVAVGAVSQQFQRGGSEAFGLIDDDQLHVVLGPPPAPRISRGLAGGDEVLQMQILVRLWSGLTRAVPRSRTGNPVQHGARGLGAFVVAWRCRRVGSPSFRAGPAGALCGT